MMLSRVRLLVVIAALGCRSGAKPHATEVVVQLVCDEHPRPLTVTGDLLLDDHLCGKPWEALQLEAGPRVELVRAHSGREVWLRRTLDHAFVEVRMRGAVTATIDRVSSIAWRGPQAQEPSLEISIGAETQRLSRSELEQRVAGNQPGKGNEISLCRLADALADHPGSITVHGEQPEPVTFTRAECASRGIVLKFATQGYIRLRATADGARILEQVDRISM